MSHEVGDAWVRPFVVSPANPDMLYEGGSMGPKELKEWMTITFLPQFHSRPHMRGGKVRIYVFSLRRSDDPTRGGRDVVDKAIFQ
jgi:hypothetical protein